MKLAKFTDTDGHTVWVNPDHVHGVAVAKEPPQGQIVRPVQLLMSGGAMAVQETEDYAVNQLTGRQVLSLGDDDVVR